MSNLTLLSKTQQSTIVELNGSGESRKLAISLVIARLLSNDLSLPSSEADIEAFYKLNHRLSVNSRLSQLNEMVLLDTPTILEYTLNLYKYRYASAYPSRAVVCFDPSTAVVNFFGISTYIDPAAFKEIETACMRITKWYPKLLDVLAELQPRDNTTSPVPESTGIETPSEPEVSNAG